MVPPPITNWQSVRPMASNWQLDSDTDPGSLIERGVGGGHPGIQLAQALDQRGQAGASRLQAVEVLCDAGQGVPPLRVSNLRRTTPATQPGLGVSWEFSRRFSLLLKKFSSLLKKFSSPFPTRGKITKKGRGGG